MSEVAKGGAVFSTALALFLLLPVTFLLMLIAIVVALRPRVPWQP